MTQFGYRIPMMAPLIVRSIARLAAEYPYGLIQGAKAS